MRKTRNRSSSARTFFLCLAVLTALLVHLLDLFRVWEVRQRSMVPTLLPGDWVASISPLLSRPIRSGDIVVARVNGVNLIKRVETTFMQDGKKFYCLIGDNVPESWDSRAFGCVPEGSLRGRVVSRIWQKGGK